MRERQAVITGLGIVSPIGIGVCAFWNAALAGRSGTGHAKTFDVTGLSPECRVVGEVVDFDLRDWVPHRLGKTTGRFSQFAIAAASMAIADSQITLDQLPAHQVSVALGTSMNGLVDVLLPQFKAFLAVGNIHSSTAREFPGQAASAHVGRHLRILGSWSTFSSACAAGLDAISWGAEQIRTGRSVAVLAGGTETPLSPATMESFRQCGWLSRWDGPPYQASRPFDRRRSGMVVSEGAAVVLIEEEDHARARGAPVYARILDSGTASEGLPGANVEQAGEIAARSMSAALRRSKVPPSAIDYICAHGNGIPDHDAAETAAIKRTFGKAAHNIAVSSVKSMCGQAFAASSAMQVVATCLALRHQAVPPTINYEHYDPDCDLDYVPNVGRTARVHYALVHVRSIGGSHTSLVLAHPAVHVQKRATPRAETAQWIGLSSSR